MAWTSHFTDSFTEASNTLLTSHTPDTGAGWSFVDGANDKGTVYAADDTLGCAFDVNLNARIYSADIAGAWAAKQKAEAIAVTTAKKRVAVRVGLTATVGRCYEAYFNGGDNTLRVYRRDSPSSVTLLISDFDNTITGSDVIGVVADGSSISAEVNGTPSASSPVADSTYSDGSPGVTVAPTLTSSGLDSFGAYDEAAAGVALVAANAVHNHTASVAGFGQVHDLAVAGAVHAETASQATLTIGNALSAANAVHIHTAATASFEQVHRLTGQSAASAHLAAVATLVTTTEIVIASTAHAVTSSNATFGAGDGTPAERLIIPGPPARTIAPAADDRTIQGER